MNRRGFLGALSAVLALRRTKPNPTETGELQRVVVEPFDAATPAIIYGIAAKDVRKGDLVQLVTKSQNQ